MTNCTRHLFALILMLGLIPLAAIHAGEYGDINVDLRLRYETAEIDGLEDADAATARLRLGYTTPTWRGFKAMVEGEFTGVADKDSYNAAGVHGDPDKAVIADPENAQLDQGFISYKYEESLEAKAGRQVIVLDNARFIGDVGWRQNRQTYDAAGIKGSPMENLTLYYAYVDNVVRIFGSDAPDSGGNAEEADSDSHLVNVSYKPCEAATITFYTYHLDLDDIPPTQSSDSVGISAHGKVPVGDELKIGYRAEYAAQEEAGDNPNDYDADYYHLVLSGSYSGMMADLGYELLGSDRTSAVDADGAPVYASFQTPLATLHKFNGFADRFLTTPPKGLEDIYVMIGYKYVFEGAGPLIFKIWYHDFSSDEGSDDLGDEWDALLVKPFEIDGVPGKFKALAKYANYSKGDVGADTERLTVELNYSAMF